MEGRSAPPAISPNPGSLEVPSPASAPVPAASVPSPLLVEGAPPSLPGVPPPAGLLLPPPVFGLPPPVLELPPPALPEELELLDPELPLDELDELGPLAPPELGDDAPELEGDDGGVGIEGVVGVLAEGHPINTSNIATTALAARGRSTSIMLAREGNVGVIRVAGPSLSRWPGSDQKTKQSYQSPRRCLPHM